MAACARPTEREATKAIDHMGRAARRASPQSPRRARIHMNDVPRRRVDEVAVRGAALTCILTRGPRVRGALFGRAAQAKGGGVHTRRRVKSYARAAAHCSCIRRWAYTPSPPPAGVVGSSGPPYSVWASWGHRRCAAQVHVGAPLHAARANP